MTVRYPSMQARILANVKMTPAPEWALVTGDCWIWQGTKNARGYGNISIRKPERKKPYPFKVLVHRLVLEVFCGIPIDSIECSMHFCGRKACCNPDHLEKGTRQENKIMHTEIESAISQEWTEADFVDWK